MTSRLITVQCPHGLHLRVASQAAKIAHASGTKVRVGCEGCPQADACSPLQLLMLGATVGTTLEIDAEGPGEALVVAALSELFENGAGI